MFLHLGQDTIVNTRSIIGVFDLDTASLSKHTRSFLAKAEKTGQVVNVSMELPKSFCVTAEAETPEKRRLKAAQPIQKKAVKETEKSFVYISQLSSATLKKRLETQQKTQKITINTEN